MRKAIYSRFVVIIVMTALFCGLISGLFFAIHEEKQVEQALTKMCKAISYQYERNPSAQSLSSVAGGDRVSIIASDGTVLDDSGADAKTMENHLNREEVKNAKEGTPIAVSRTSETVGRPYMYAAIKMSDGTILRLAHGYGGIMSGVAKQLPVMLFSTIAGSILAVFVAGALSKKVIGPLEKFTDNLALGNYDTLNDDQSYYEIGKITSKINDLLRERILSQKEIRIQHDKINFILSNMAEGFIMLNDDKKIGLINSSAQNLFGCQATVHQQSFVTLTRNRKIDNAVDKALEDHASSVFDLPMNDTVYSVHVSPISGKYVDSEDKGVTILLVDVGAERKSLTQRSEFFSNASHELKTPITSVMGFADMLVNGLVEEGKQEPIYHRIYTEAQRMNSLIDDILTISRLESGVVVDISERVNLKEVANEVINALAPQAKALDVTISLAGEDVCVQANRRQIHELINNLVTNAVKYNKPKGSVAVTIESTVDKIVICVHDTGIGIPDDAQSRIFERFYRVEPGRSKSIGGTGLGLSIVKHIVLSWGGEITLQSKAPGGTTIVVSLPG